jgi:RNA polymerase sigma-70 factor (ECF subfamily)
VNRQEEADLARSLLRGDEAAFDRFVEHYRRKIFQYTWLMCGNPQDAEEVAQETLLKVFEKSAQLDKPENARAWVFRIARNECLMMRRKSVFAPERELSLDEFLPESEPNGEGGKLQIADWKNLPEDAVLQAELREEIRQGIRDLPETYRAVVLLRDMEELSTEETAHVLDLGTDVVKTRLHRGRLALRQRLDAYLHGKEQRHAAR